VEEEQRLNELKRAEEKEKLRHQREEEEKIRQQQREEELELIRLREAMRSEMQSDVDVQSTRPTSGLSFIFYHFLDFSVLPGDSALCQQYLCVQVLKNQQILKAQRKMLVLQ
jgi:hypothetical protein